MFGFLNRTEDDGDVTACLADEPQHVCGRRETPTGSVATIVMELDEELFVVVEHFSQFFEQLSAVPATMVPSADLERLIGELPHIFYLLLRRWELYFTIKIIYSK